MLNTLRVQAQPYQLDNAIREAILQRSDGKGLVVLEGLYFLKYKAETWLTFDQIYRLLSQNFSCSYRLVYEGLQTKLIFMRKKSKPKAHQRGAPPYLYRIPCPAELKAEYAPEEKVTPSDRLKKADLKSLTTYRMALHRELYIRKWVENDCQGFKMYRDLQADRLGVSKRTVRTYDKKLGFSYEANYSERRIDSKDWNSLPRYKESFDSQGNRLPSRKWLKVVDWKTGRSQNLPYVAYLAYVNLQADLAVYEVEREANTYYPYNRPKRENYDDIGDHYYATVDALEIAGFCQNSDGSWYQGLIAYSPDFV